VARDEAKKFYDRNPGDPPDKYITPQDAQDAIDVIYNDIEELTRASQQLVVDVFQARSQLGDVISSVREEAEAALRLAGEAMQSAATLESEIDGVRQVAMAAAQAASSTVTTSTLEAEIDGVRRTAMAALQAAGSGAMQSVPDAAAKAALTGLADGTLVFQVDTKELSLFSGGSFTVLGTLN
jgi:hypothetical protein